MNSLIPKSAKFSLAPFLSVKSEFGQFLHFLQPKKSLRVKKFARWKTGFKNGECHENLYK